MGGSTPSASRFTGKLLRRIYNMQYLQQHQVTAYRGTNKEAMNASEVEEIIGKI